MKLSFTTLGCPQWSWERIVEQARVMGYDGIEVRGLLDELDLEKLEPFAGENINATKSRLKQLELSIPCLDTSCTFLSGTAFDETLREGKAAISLAQKLGVPWIRVFGDRIPEGMALDFAVKRVAQGMNELGACAQGTGVRVLLETHGHFASAANLEAVFARVDSPDTGILWDIANPYEFGDTVNHTWERLNHLIYHAHIKDITAEGKPCLPGKGQVPIGKAIKLLADGGYTGWLSFEWEKRWHPELDGPEIALAQFINYIAQYL